jgi:membrane protease YdiL (CAAX protease family)
MNLKTVFFNDFNRLRSGWRFAVFQLLIVFFGGVFGTGAQFLLDRMGVDFPGKSTISFAAPSVFLLFFALFFGWLCGKFLEDLPFRALGISFTKNWSKDLFFGLLFGTLSIGLAVLIAFLFGGMRLEFNSSVGNSAILQTLAVSFVIFLGGAAAEEAYFRGYILQTFARAQLAWLAIAFTSLFFAFAHFLNPNVSGIGKFNTAIAGVWFGIAYLKTRNLWFPLGIHFAWNWLQGAIFGIPVSGITEITTAPLLRETATGSDFFTGGNYGVEGGIACTIAIIFSSALIWFAPFLKPTEEMLKLTSEEKRIAGSLPANVAERRQL